MPSPRSLSRVEAQERAELLSVREYQVDLDLDVRGETFSSRTTIRFDSTRPGASTWLELKPDRLRTARLNGAELRDDAFDAAQGRLRLPAIAAQNELVVEASMRYSRDGEGLHRHEDPADGRTYLYAMSFLDAAPRWFACFDQPDLKAPVTLTVRCEPSWTVLGNARAVSLGDGHWRLGPTPPMSTYLVTVVAGPYHGVRAEHDGIALGVHARASLADHLDREADDLLTHTAASLDEFHRLFECRYPWGDYQQAFVPDFQGAMENPGCVTLGDAMIYRSRATAGDRDRRAITVAHEMAHMWFGDLVTMRWWDDLWLNESFAEYLGHQVCIAAGRGPAWLEFGTDRKAWGYAADRRPSTHPVAGNGAADAATALSDFDGISYAKGASVVRQLAAWLGEPVFLGGLRRYIDEHAFGNAEFADLMRAWTQAGAVGLPAWARAWLRTSGMDALRVARTDIGTALLREPPPGTAGVVAARPHAIVVAGYGADGTAQRRVPVEISDDRTDIAGMDAPLVLPDAGDQTWARIALDPGGWALLPRALPNLDATARAVAWNALRLAVADAELDPQIPIEVGLASLGDEDNASILSASSRWVVDTCAGIYLNPAHRAAALTGLAAVLLTALDQCAAGSDRQLATARAAVPVADEAVLRDWLGGHGPHGLIVDAELRWLVLRRLAALGVLDDAEIDRELAADRSAEGLLHAATCRSGRPDFAAKAAAWQRMLHSDDAVNSELYALAAGFWHPDHTAQTAPFVDRYFAEIAGLTNHHSGWLAGRLAVRLYPQTAVAAATVAATERLLDQDLDVAIRRAVVDGGDDLRRAVASRQRYAALPD